MPTEKIKTIDGQTLLSLELPPTRFIVDKVLPQGFHIFSGVPKVGKSWLLLSLCLQVAKGEKFWNYQTEKGTVLYLCLEDNNNRLQDRLTEITDTAPPTLHFAVNAHSLTENLSEQLELFITDHPDTLLIVIDTLQRIRDGAKDSNMYAQDYKDISALKSIADKHRIAIIGVQHLRKQFDNDPHQMISGSTGLVGAADGSYVLKKEKVTDTNAKLYIRGRDIEERVFFLRFNNENMLWEFLESSSPSAESLKNDKAMELLTAYMKTAGEFVGTASELSEKIGGNIKPNVLTRKLSTYQKDLAEIGIEFVKSRTGERRELILLYEPKKAV